jgi:hypothetical protein
MQGSQLTLELWREQRWSFEESSNGAAAGTLFELRTEQPFGFAKRASTALVQPCAGMVCVLLSMV